MILPYIQNNIQSFSTQFIEAQPFPYSFFSPFLDHPTLNLTLYEHSTNHNTKPTTTFLSQYLKNQNTINLIQLLTNSNNLSTTPNNQLPSIELFLFLNNQQNSYINLWDSLNNLTTKSLLPTFNSCLIIHSKNLKNCQITSPDSIQSIHISLY